jgi:hypothetical protein
MPRLVPVRTEHVGPGVFFHELSAILTNWQRKEQIVEPNPRLDLDDRFMTRRTCGDTSRRGE